MRENTIYYSQCWEDPLIVLEALSICSDDRVLSVTSGGENSLAILIAGASYLVSIDSNPAQNYLLELKYKESQILTYDEYLEFLGIRDSKRRIYFFANIKSELSEQAQRWWLDHEDFISSGIIHCGRFDKYVRFFARYIIPLIHRKQTIRDFLGIKNIKDQWKFYNNIWNSGFWKCMFDFATRSQLLRRSRHNEMFLQTEKISTTKEYVRRLEKNIASVLISRNYFMHYSLQGNYLLCLPFYLQEKNYKKLQKIHIKNDSTLLYVSQDLLSYLQMTKNDTFTKFNLSDIFEALSLEENNKIWDEIVRTAKSGAKIIYWNNLVERTYPQYLSRYIKSDKVFQDKLRKKDRVYFYNKVYVHTIIK